MTGTRAVSAVHLIAGSDARSVEPDARLFERARNLATEFPDAGLRRVSLVRAQKLDARARGRVWLALEALQTTGSFKVRGALLALDELRRRGVARVVAASAGNHGAGVAHAARVLGMEAIVFVPSSTPEKKRKRIEQGATMVLAKSAHYDAAEREAREFARASNLPFVSPYDDPAVVAGNGASLGFEIASELGHVPGRVFVPVGGGGLATGVATALKMGRADVRVFGVQSEASPAFAMSIESGRAVETLELDVPTLAEGLEGGISQAAFERTRAALNAILVVTEDAIARAMLGIHAAWGHPVEGSGAAALAPLLDELPPQLHPPKDAEDDVVVLVTGGNVDDDRLAALRAKLGAGAGDAAATLW